MKLVFAIVHNEDGHNVMDSLNQNGFSVTKLCSTGGFLKSGNTTLITVVDENKVDEVIEIIKNESKSRKQVVNSSIAPIELGGVFAPYPLEVVIGGGTIFVVDVERFEKV